MRTSPVCRCISLVTADSYIIEGFTARMSPTTISPSPFSLIHVAAMSRLAANDMGEIRCAGENRGKEETMHGWSGTLIEFVFRVGVNHPVLPTSHSSARSLSSFIQLHGPKARKKAVRY